MIEILPPEETGIFPDIRKACVGLTLNEKRSLFKAIRMAMEIHLASQLEFKRLGMEFACRQASAEATRHVA